MVKLKCNYGKKRNCKICEKEEESTEHVISCQQIADRVKEPVPHKIEDATDVTEWIKITEYMEKARQVIEEADGI